MNTSVASKNDKHKTKMQKQKQRIDSQIEKNSLEKGVMIFLTGDGKGKTSSAFGMVLRALGYNHKVGVVQFIKGQQLSGEELYLHPVDLISRMYRKSLVTMRSTSRLTS